MKVLLFGAGHLGLQIGQNLKAGMGKAGRAGTVEVLAVTETERRHAQIAAAGLVPILASQLFERLEHSQLSFDSGVLVLPPSIQGLEKIVELFRNRVRGPWLQISSTGVYKTTDGHSVFEDSELGEDERALRLRHIEDQVVNAGGSVLRLAGLYDQELGPHRVYQRTSESSKRADGWVNLVHYQDAAAIAAVSVFKIQIGQRWMFSDGHPIQRSEIARLVGATCAFKGDERLQGNRLVPRLERWGYALRYHNFQKFCASADGNLGNKGAVV